MESRKRSLAPIVLLVLVFFASTLTCEHYQVEAKVCQIPSKTFWGICVSDRHCAGKCMKEGYGGGQCEGVRRRCLCQKRC